MGVLSDVAAGLEVRQYDSPEELLSLESEWSALCSRCPGATPFQSPAWLIPFSTHVCDGTLWVIAIRQRGQLVGVAPFFIHAPRPGHERHLYLLGTGISDYLDVLFEPDLAEACVSTLWAVLHARHEKWDVCDWQQLRSGSFLLAEEAPTKWTSTVNVQEVCPVLRLPEAVSALPGCVPWRMLEKLRHCRRRLQKLSPWSVESATLESFDAIFDRFLKLPRSRWTSRGQDGVLPDERLESFHRQSAYRFLLAGALRLYSLIAQGQIIATLYGFAHRDRTYFYLGSFDPAFAPYSPGTLLIGHAIEEATREGSTDFDFLRGREAYKYMWGAKARLNYRRQMWFIA